MEGLISVKIFSMLTPIILLRVAPTCIRQNLDNHVVERFLVVNGSGQLRIVIDHDVVEVEQEKGMVYTRQLSPVITNVQMIGSFSVNRPIIIVKVEVPGGMEVLEELVKDIAIRVVQGVVILAILEAPGLVEEARVATHQS